MPASIKFLDPYEKEDKAIFFGRKEETKNLFNRVNKSSICVLHGASGTGKTSLIQCGLANMFDECDWMEILVRRGSDRTIIEATASELKKIITDKDFPITAQGIFRELQNIYYDNYRRIYLIFDQFEELFINALDDEKADFKSILQLIHDNEEKFVTVIIVIRGEYYTNLNFLNPEVPISLISAIELKHIKQNVLKEEVIRQIFTSSNIICDNSEGNIIDEIISNTTTVNRDAMAGETVELPYLQVYLDKLFEKLHIGKETGKDDVVTIVKKDLPPPIKLEDALGNFLEEKIQEIAHEPDTVFNKDDIWKMLKLLVTSEGTKRGLSFTTVMNEFGEGEARTKLLLQKLSNKKVIRFNEELYELKHDFLALKVANKWSEEEQVINLVTNIVKSSMKLRNNNNNVAHPQSNMTEDQFILFKRYKDKLNFNYDEREEYLAFYEECENEYEKVRKGKELQYKLQLQLTDEAIDQKTEADKQRNKAEKQEKIALLKKRNARAWAYFSYLLLLVTMGLYISERRTKLELFTANAKSYLALDNFKMAGEQVKAIDKTRCWVPSFFAPEQLRKDLSFLQNTLFFHLVADNIHPNNDFILSKDFAGFKITKTAMLTLARDSGFNEKQVPNNQEYWSGNSNDGSKYFIAKQNNKTGKSSLTTYTVQRNSNGSFFSMPTFIDSVDIAAAAFDSTNTLYFFNNNAIYSYNRGLCFEEIKVPLADTKKTKLSLEFIINGENEVSNILLVTINSFYFYCNIANKYKLLTKISDDQSKLLIDSIKNQSKDHSHSPDGKKFLFVTSDSMIAGYIDKEKHKNFAIRKKLEPNVDSLVAGLPLDNMLVYISFDTKKGSQKVCFVNYNTNHTQNFDVPNKWEFCSFKYNKYMLFNLYGEHRIVRKQALLLIDSDMVGNTPKKEWFH